MWRGSLHRSILRLTRGRSIQSLLSHYRSAFVGCSRSNAVCPQVFSCQIGSGIKLPESNDIYGRYHVAAVTRVSRTLVRATSTTTGGTTERSVVKNFRHDYFLDRTAKVRIAFRESALSRFKSIKISDAEEKILGGENSEQPVKIFVIDTETTGLSKDRDRIIEIAIRDLSGGENSCFQTLVNPEVDVPNSRFHGITTSMVNHPDVPRMQELIPILLQYIKSREIPGGISLFVAHNARHFDVPFLIKEFSRCSVDIPPYWRYLDSIPMVHELRRSNGSKLPLKASLTFLREHYDIPVQGSPHRAMTDVNLLTEVLERMCSDLQLTKEDLIERAFKASDLINLKSKTKRS